MELGKKKLSMEWQVLCGLSLRKWSANIPWEDLEVGPGKPLDYAAGVYAVDVYLTE